MSLPQQGRTYRFKCAASSTRRLNLYSSGTAADGMNVVLYDPDETNEQKWYYDDGKLHIKTNTQYCLDRFIGNSALDNADIYLATEADNDEQLIAFEEVDGYTNRVKIKLQTKVDNKTYYLTSYSDTNGNNNKTKTSLGNVFWREDSTSDLQKWDFEEVDAPGGEDGTDTTQQKLILPLNNTILSASYKNTAYEGTFGYVHYGIDQYSNYSTTIYGSGTGTVIAKGWDEKAGNVVVVKYPKAHNHKTNVYEDVIFRYFHLDSIGNISVGDSITKDTVLGYYGGSGMGQQNYWSPHLHIEADTDTDYPCYSPTFSVGGSIIKGVSFGANDSTCHSALEYLYKKTSAPDNQTYTTDGNEYINSGDETLPSF